MTLFSSAHWRTTVACTGGLGVRFDMIVSPSWFGETVCLIRWYQPTRFRFGCQALLKTLFRRACPSFTRHTLPYWEWGSCPGKGYKLRAWITHLVYTPPRETAVDPEGP